jgi:predicted AlkP superfamily phosphohydrolase/phosphomutase
MQAAPKVLLVALDAMDAEFALDWAAQGMLPALQALRERAIWGRIENPVGFYVGGVWPSFHTSASPASHGQYCWRQFDPKSYRDLEPPYDDGDATPWWHALDRAGREVAIVDLPRTICAPERGGLQVHDWGTHDALAPGFVTSPPELAAEILERYGADPVGDCNALPRAEPRHYRELLARLKRRVSVKRELARDLMGRWSWDLFALGFGEAHCVAHQCWHVRDPAHPRHDPQLARELGDPLLEVYRALDAALAELVSAAGREARLLVILSHGVGPHYDGDHLIDEALARIEKRLAIGRSLSFAERIAFRLRTRRRARPAFAGVIERRPERAFRKAFRVPNNEAFAGIRINLAGREAHGRIQPGAEFEDLCDALERELLWLRNGDTGEPAFVRVERCDQHFAGPRLELLPDLLAEWSRAAEFRSLESPTIGRIEGRFEGVRTGDHRPQGCFFAAGPGLKPKSVKEPVSVMDFGPTVAAWLGVELADVDGEPIAELLAGPAT